MTEKKESAWKFTGRPHFTIWGYIEMPAGENKPVTAEFETLEECHGYLVTKRIELPGILQISLHQRNRNARLLRPERARQLLGRLLRVVVMQHQIMPKPCQMPGDGSAYAFTCAGDEGGVIHRQGLRLRC